MMHVIYHDELGLVALRSRAVGGTGADGPAAAPDPQAVVNTAFNQYKDSRKARTPTTSRRSPRWIRICSASRW